MISSNPSRFRKAWWLAAILVALAVAAACWAYAHHDSVHAALRGLDPRTDARPAAPSGPEISSPDYARLGDGFLVWESNRTGPWRIWTRRLDGSGLRQLTPDESGHEHWCAHI